MKKPLTAATVTLAMLGTVLTVPAAASEPASPAAAQAATSTTKKQAKRSAAIVSPKASAAVRRHTVSITVRAPNGIRKAQVNGKRLAIRDFRLAADGIRRTAHISSSHGLRHGRNVVRVTINKRYQGTVTKTVRFTVKGKQLLTGAGRDRRIVSGASVNLKVATVRHPSLRGAPTSTSWRIVSKPAGSNAVLKRADARTPRLRTDVPGEYIVKATAMLGGKKATATSDSVTVSAPSAPMVPFTAWSEDGNGVLGISVGGRFYPDSMRLDQAAWQMLVFDRNTLGVNQGDNRTYGPCNGGWCVARDGGGPVESVDIAADLKELGPNNLVILVHRSQYGQSATPNPFTQAFGIPDKAQPAPGESAAIVAVPGANGGVHTYMHDTAGKADLSGYLMQDRYFNYTFVDDARVPFDTRAAQNCDATSCSVTVTAGSGADQVSRTYSAANGQAGLAVLRFDRRTLATRDTQFFLTNGVSPDQIRGNLAATAEYLKGVAADELVLITSVVAPGAVLMGKPSPIIGGATDTVRFIAADGSTSLGTQIARLGGSRHRLLQAGLQANAGYTLVGYPGLKEGQGNERHAEQARLSGVLQRDGSQMFVARNVSPGPNRYDAFTSSVMDAPGTQAWPGQGQPAYAAVLACLADGKSGLNPSDPRASYWNNSTQITAQDWNTWYTQVSKAQFSDCPGTDRATFDQAAPQFAKELQYNYFLRSYVETLKKPYSAKAAVTALADVDKWSSELKASSDEVKSKGVQVDWYALLATAIEAVAPFLAPYLGGKAGKAAEKLVEMATHALSAATAGALEFGGGILETDETGEKYLEDDKFNAEVGKLGAEVVDRLLATADNLDRMGDVVASDYTKLSRIGGELLQCQKDENAGRTPGAPGFTCDPSFFANNITVAKAEATASHTAEQTIYEKVLPLTYPVTSVPWDGVVTQGFGEPEGNWNATNFDCFNAVPFPASWPEASKPFLRRSLGQYLDPAFIYSIWDGATYRDASQTPQFDTYVIAAFGKDRFNVATAEETVERLFGEATDSTDPSDGGLGADPVDFVLDQIAEGKVKDYPLSCGGWEDSNTVPAPLDR